MVMRARTAGVVVAGVLLSTALWAAPLELPENGRLEITTWVAGQPEYSVRHECTLVGTNIRCEGTIRVPVAHVETRDVLEGTLVAGTLKASSHATTQYTDPACTATYVSKGGMTLTLEAGGRGHGTWDGGSGTYTKASARCAVLVGRTDQQAAQQVVASWQVLAAEPAAGFGDASLKAALWKQLGQAEGPLARKCFDETFAKLKEPRNADILERLEAAALQEHLIETATRLAKADDFDPEWMAAAKAIGGDGSAGQRITDKLVRFLPGPFGPLISLSQKAYRLSLGASEKVVMPQIKGKLYEAFAAERARRPNDPPAEVLKDASAHVGGWSTMKAGLIRHFPGANDEAREVAMAQALATRFDFLAKVRSIAASREQHLAAAWRETANDLARIRMTMLDCMAK